MRNSDPAQAIPSPVSVSHSRKRKVAVAIEEAPRKRSKLEHKRSRSDAHEDVDENDSEWQQVLAGLPTEHDRDGLARSMRAFSSTRRMALVHDMAEALAGHHSTK